MTDDGYEKNPAVGRGFKFLRLNADLVAATATAAAAMAAFVAVFTVFGAFGFFGCGCHMNRSFQR